MKWEYKFVEAKDHGSFVQMANEMGSDRWELVHVEYVNKFVIGFFKRKAD